MHFLLLCVYFILTVYLLGFAITFAFLKRVKTPEALKTAVMWPIVLIAMFNLKM